jgi:hypothetical protein
MMSGEQLLWVWAGYGGDVREHVPRGGEGAESE